MKKVLILLFVFAPVLLSAQKKEIKEKYKQYTESNYYKIDGANIVVSAVIDGVIGTKEDIYIKVKNYFTRAYGSANAVIQTDDKEQGVIIGKGIYSDLYVFKPLGVLNMYLGASHILRVDIKEGRIRVICSADTWNDYDNKRVLFRTLNIVDYAPITDKRFFDKGKQTIAFINLVENMHSTIDELEKSIKEGSLAVENEDW